MPGQDVRQLLLQVDASVAVAQRNLSTLRNQVERDSTAMESALAKPGAASEAAGERIAHGSGNARIAQMELMHVVRASADQFAAGAPPMQVFTMHLSQLAQAASFAGEGMGRFGAFMGSGWGIAIAAGASVLLPLVARLFDTRTELEKATAELATNARNADTTRQAQEAFAHSLPGIEAAIRSETEALEGQNRSLAQNQQLMLDRANRNLSDLRSQQDSARRDLENSRTALQTARAATQGRGRSGAHDFEALTPEPAVSAAEQRIAEAERRLSAINALIPQAEREIRDAHIPIAVREAEAMVDPIVRINQHYDAMADSARAAAAANDRLTASLANTLAAINRQRNAALATERERQHHNEDRAPDIISSLYRPVPGSVLSPFGVQRPGHRHAGADLNAQFGSDVHAPMTGWATTRLDRQTHPGDPAMGLYVIVTGDNGLTAKLAHLSSTQVPRNGERVRVEQGQVIAQSGGGRGLVNGMPRFVEDGNAAGTAPHVHYEIWQNGHPVNPVSGRGGQSVVSAQEAAEALRDRRAHADETFENEKAALNARLLQAIGHQVQTADQAAAADVEQIGARRDQANLRYQHEADDLSRRDEGNAALYQAHARELIAANNHVAAVEIDTRQTRERVQQQQDRIDIQLSELNSAEGVEQARGRLAETTRERLASELRLLDMQHQEELLQIQKLRLGGSLNDAQRAELDNRERAINERYQLAVEGTQRDNEGPAARRIRALRGEVGDLNVAFENLGVSAMDRLVDSTTNEIKALLGVHGVLGDIIGDFVQLALHQGEMSLLNSLSGGGGKGGGGSGLGGFIHSLGSIFGGSSGGGKLGGGGGQWAQLANLGFKAEGGRVSAGMPYIVGERRPELFVPDTAGTIIPRVPQVRIPQAANMNGHVQVEVTLDNNMLQGRIVRTSAGVNAAMAPATASAGAGQALETAARRASRRIPTGF